MKNIDQKEVMNTLVATMAAKGYELKNGKVNDIYVGVEIRETYPAGSSGMYYRRRPTGYQIRVGERFGHLRSVGFRQLKDGSFNYDRIADKLIEHRQQQIAITQRRQEADKRTENAVEARDRIVAEKNIETWSSPLNIEFSRMSGAGSLVFKLNNIKPEHAEKFMDLAIELGIAKVKA